MQTVETPSLNKMMMNNHLKGTTMHHTSSMINQIPINARVKTTSTLQKLTCAIRLTHVLKNMIPQMYVMILVYDMIHIQLHLQK